MNNTYSVDPDKAHAPMVNTISGQILVAGRPVSIPALELVAESTGVKFVMEAETMNMLSVFVPGTSIESLKQQGLYRWI